MIRTFHSDFLSNKETEEIMKLKLILSTLLIGLVSLNTYSAPRVFEQIKKWIQIKTEL